MFVFVFWIPNKKPKIWTPFFESVIRIPKTEFRIRSPCSAFRTQTSKLSLFAAVLVLFMYFVIILQVTIILEN